MRNSTDLGSSVALTSLMASGKFIKTTDKDGTRDVSAGGPGSGRRPGGGSGQKQTHDSFKAGGMALKQAGYKYTGRKNGVHTYQHADGHKATLRKALTCDRCGEPVTVAGDDKAVSGHYIHDHGLYRCIGYNSHAIVNGKVRP